MVGILISRLTVHDTKEKGAKRDVNVSMAVLMDVMMLMMMMMMMMMMIVMMIVMMMLCGVA